ncbi:hypothetical protein [Paraburkholderia caballeronis]|uniref:hypothetical protein n=1 Tax=Paraburkholderia caballeronis TaxID=416943 RepID=UPI001431810D|nr:hypothetical protein [Paraburkholderia caballeronis]
MAQQQATHWIGALYRLERWTPCGQPATGRPLAVAQQDNLQQIFDEGTPPPA